MRVYVFIHTFLGTFHHCQHSLTVSLVEVTPMKGFLLLLSCPCRRGLASLPPTPCDMYVCMCV